MNFFMSSLTGSSNDAIDDGWEDDDADDGWDNDDEGLDDLLDDDDGVGGDGGGVATDGVAAASVNSTQPQPPIPPAVVPASNLFVPPPPPPPPASGDAVIMDAGWDDDGLDGLDDDDDDDDVQPTQVTATTKPVPIPPPPPPPARPVAVQSELTDDAGWDDDIDGLLDDIDEPAETPDAAQPAVPPLAATTAPLPTPTIPDAVADDAAGWDDDEAILNDIDPENLANNDSTPHDGDDQIPLVDHTPPPPPPPSTAASRRTDVTNDAVASTVESVWADDEETLSNMDGIAVTASAIEPSSIFAPRLVDHTPLPPPPPPGDRLESASSMAVFGTDVSVAETLDSIDEESYHRSSISSTSMLRSSSSMSKMVDHTPAPTARLVRGTSPLYESSLAAMGAASIGESLNSISEGEEDDDNENDGDALDSHKPESSRRSRRSTYTISFHEDSTVYPFGASSPPAFLSREQSDDTAAAVTVVPLKVPLVDHTPSEPASRRFNPSVDPMNGSSSEEELDAGQDNHFGKVVDHTPETPQAKKKPSVSNMSTMDDTVLGFADKTDVDADIRQDNDMDDFSHDDSTQVTGFGGTLDLDGEIIRNSLVINKTVEQEESHLVDHVPRTEVRGRRRTDASTFALAGASQASSVHDDGDDDDTLPSGFGPIVDHTPSVIAPTPPSSRHSVFSAATSVITQMTGLQADLKLDEELEDTIYEVEDGWEEDDAVDVELANGADASSTTATASAAIMPPPVPAAAATNNKTMDAPPKEENLVDHVPETKHNLPDGSVRTLEPCDASTDNPDTIAGDTVTDFGPVVDHTPVDSRSVAHSVAASMAPQAYGIDADIRQSDDMEENTLEGVGEGWENGDDDDDDDNDDDTFDDHHIPFVNSDGGGNERHLVDHVPKTTPRVKPADASTIVMADPADLASTVDDFNDENVRSDRFGKVVDQTPAPRSLNHSIATSMATHGAGAVTGSETKNEDDMDGTWFGASTIGGSTGMGDGWDDDDVDVDDDDDVNIDDDLEDKDGDTDNNDETDLEKLDAPNMSTPPTSSSLSAITKPHKDVVDHVPTQKTAPPGDSSVAVVVDPSVVADNKKEDNNDSNIDTGSFGAIVDQTPVARHKSIASVATSLATAVSDINTELKRDQDMDASTWNDGVRSPSADTDQDGWENDEAELDGIENDPPAPELPHLVDHVPERPESRHTDASTLDVVADPSEMQSQVDEFGQEEQNFGPVVDVTPFVRQNLPSVAGSTAVIPPSVVEDDLDDAVDTAGGEDQQNGWENDDLDIITETPNPQSGNEDDSNREQLVDYLPVENEVPEPVQDASSEMATVGEKSALPPDDPKEDEFGPVVDHTPVPNMAGPAPVPAAATVATAAAAVASESDSMLLREDSKPPAVPTPLSRRALDSVAAQFSTASSSKDDDGDEEDEFGPVVDQLPFISSRSSLAPSRGGSTVDALATVSEVDDDSIGEEDGSIDGQATEVSEHVHSLGARATDHSADERNLSVKWVDSLTENDAVVTASHGVGGPSMSDEAEFYDAEMGDMAVNNTRYLDPDSTERSDWSSSVILDQDDTPPSTPKGRYSLETNLLNDAELGMTPKRNGSSSNVISNEMIENVVTATTPSTDPSCPSCSNSSGAECPCVASLIASNAGDDRMVGTLKTPKGDVQINFEKLLQEEILKRQLLEKEIELVRSSNEALKAKNGALQLRSKTDVESLQKSNQSLVDESKLTSEKLKELEAHNGALKKEMDETKKRSEQLQADKKKLEASEKELRSRMDSTANNIALEKDHANQQLQKCRAELDALKHSHMQLDGEKSQLESQLTSMKDEANNLTALNTRQQESLSENDKTISDLNAQNASKVAEIKHLKKSLHSAMAQVSTEEQVKTQMHDLQSLAASKEAQLAEMKAHLDEARQQLKESEEKIAAHAKEKAMATKQHKQEIAKFHLQSAEDKMKIAGLYKEKKNASVESTKQLAAIRANEKSLQDQTKNLEMEIKRLGDDHKTTLQGLQAKLDGSQNEVAHLTTQVQVLAQEKAALQSKLSESETSGQRMDTMAGELATIAEERTALQAELQISRQMVSHLETQNKELAKASEMLESSKREGVSLRQLAESLRKAMAAKDVQIKALTNQRGAMTQERNDARKQLDETKARCLELEERAKTANQLALQDESRILSMQQEMDALKADLTHKSENSVDSNQLQRAIQRCNDLERQLQEAGIKIEQMSHAETAMKNDLQSHANMLAERDHLRQELHQRSQAFAQLEQRLMQAESLLNEKDLELRRMQEAAKDTGMRFQVVDEEKAAFENRIEQLQEIAKILDDDKVNLTQTIETNLERIAELERNLHEATVNNGELNEEMQNMQNENEEMLVQFALMKEQIDAADNHISVLQDEIEQRNAAIIELENERDEQAEDSYNRHAQTAASDEKITALRQKISTLEGELEDRREESQQRETQLHQSEQRHTQQTQTIEEMQQHIGQLQSASGQNDQQMTTKLQGLIAERNSIAEEKAAMARQLEQAAKQLQALQNQQQNQKELQGRLEFLERTHGDQQMALQQKDVAIQELQGQLTNAMRGSQSGTETIDALHHKVNEMTAAAEMGRGRIRELEITMESTTKELESVRMKLSEAESELFDLQMDFDAKKRDEIDAALAALTADVKEKTESLSAMQDENAAMHERMQSLEEALATSNEQAAAKQVLQDDNQQMFQSLQALKTELQDLKEQKAQSESEGRSRESNMQHELESLQSEMSRRNEQIEKQQSQLDDIDESMRTMQEESRSKSEELHVLSQEYEALELQNKQMAAQLSIYEGDEDIHQKMAQMTEDIVALASALEQAEIMRAEALEKLEEERKTHAVAMKHWSEHVKRLYVDINCGNM